MTVVTKTPNDALQVTSGLPRIQPHHERFLPHLTRIRHCRILCACSRLSKPLRSSALPATAGTMKIEQTSLPSSPQIQMSVMLYPGQEAYEKFVEGVLDMASAVGCA